MKLQAEILINAPSAAVWTVLGERFGYISDWATPITASSIDREPSPGAVRTCHIRPFGPVPAGTIFERLTAFDPIAQCLTYEAAGGMPSFIKHASNTWSVHRVSDTTAIVRTDATLELRGVMALFAFALRWRMQKDGARVLEELKHWVEHTSAHPRKLQAIGSASTAERAQIR